MSRFARHKDTAHRPTVIALRATGASVEAMDLTDGPDLLIGHKGVTLLMEVKTLGALTKKDGYTRKVTGKLSEGQAAWHAAWKGAPVLTVYGPEEALTKMGVSAQKIAHLKVLTRGWTKDIAPKPVQAAKERSFRPGTDRARSLGELCARYDCITSQAPGQSECTAHAAEAFAPPTSLGAEMMREMMRPPGEENYEAAVKRAARRKP